MTTSRLTVDIRQYRWPTVLGIWAIATGSMGLAAWVAGPLLAQLWDDPNALLRGLLVAFTIALLVQLSTVLVAVRREQGRLGWATLRRGLWLTAPQSPRHDTPRLKVWWMLIPWAVVLAATTAIPSIGTIATRDFSLVLETDAARAFYLDNWGWLALTVAMLLLNTVFAEEVLFRGLLLPRMQTCCGRRAWAVNALLFAGYHVHQPWTMLNVVGAGAVFAYTSQRYRSAWFGIALHSIQTVVIGALLLALVLGVDA